eukprot:m.45266 g.45266  ORF g.45266 m.45266 type:complete len:374 (-) comp15122_c0_seq1:22-1143(-)
MHILLIFLIALFGWCPENTAGRERGPIDCKEQFELEEFLTQTMEVPASMRAVRVHKWGGPEVLQVVDVPVPKCENGEDVLVKIEYAGINPVDTYIRTGTYAIKPTLPYTPGSDGGGVVVATGANVSTFRLGQRVYVTGPSTGTYAQYALAHQSMLHPLPEGISTAQGAAIGIAYRTAYRALFIRGGVKPGSIVLVHGASGGVGIAAVQLAVAAGAIVYGTASSSDGRAMLQENGCAHVFDHSKDGYMSEVLHATPDHRGVDVIVEMLANHNLGHDLKVLARGGTVAVVGSRGTVEVNPRDLMVREAAIVGVMGGTPAEIAEGFAAINAGLHSGTLHPIVASKQYSLDTIQTAHHDVIAREDPGTRMGKLVAHI